MNRNEEKTSRASTPIRLAVLSYLAHDLPMMVSIGLSKALRTLGRAAGISTRLAVLACLAYDLPMRALIGLNKVLPIFEAAI